MNIFENSFFINLEEDLERKSKVESEFLKIGIKVNHFPAIKRVDGAVGTTLTHKKILESAIENDFDNVTIFEDDIFFMYDKEKTIDIINRGLSVIGNDWDILYLGCNLMENVDYISEDVYRTYRAFGAFAYIINRRIFKQYYNLFPMDEEKISGKNRTIVDQILKYSDFKKFLIPCVNTGQNVFSNNQKKIIDYSKDIIDNYNKYGVKLYGKSDDKQ